MRTRKNFVSLSKMNEEFFSAQDLAAALNNYSRPAGLQQNPVDDEQVSPQEAILNYLKFLEGIRINIKGIHWSTRETKTHKVSSDLIKILDELQDSIAEDMQGFYGMRLKVGDLIPTDSKLESLPDIIKVVLNETIVLKASIVDIDGLDGIVSILDSAMHDLNVGRYLESMEH